MNAKIKILLLEDNKSDADLLQYELKRSGFNFTATVVQTREGFESALESFDADIILSDYSLPSFDGLSAFKIKQKKCPDIPFIIVSGTIGEENAVELIKNGVTDYSLKDKLFALGPKITRALKEAKERSDKKIIDKKLKKQYQELLEIAFLQSHQVRAPIASILGLISLINMENPNDPRNTEIIKKLKTTTVMFDDVIRQIVQKTSSIQVIH